MAGMLDNTGATSSGDPTTISKGAQDVSKAQGVAYTDLATSETNRDPVNFATYDPSEAAAQLNAHARFADANSYVDKASMTVQGQMESLLAQDSSYMQLARQKGQEAAAGRGMLNSSIAGRQGELAAIESALPIAQQDAKMFSEFGRAKQQAEYGQQTIQSEAIVSGALVEQKAMIERKQQDLNNAFTARMSGVDAQQKAWLQDFQQQFSKGMTELEQAHQQQMLTMELNQNQAMAVAEHSAGIMQNYQVSVENLLSDPDFLEMGKPAVNNAINQLQTLASNSIGFIGASQGVKMDTWLDEYLDNLTVL